MGAPGDSWTAEASFGGATPQPGVRSLLAWSAVGLQLGVVPGVVLWAVVVRVGLYTDRRLGWIVVGGCALLGAAVGPMVRKNWPDRWFPPATATAVALAVGAYISWLAGTIAGEGPSYSSPSVHFRDRVAASVLCGVLAVVPIGALRWRSSRTVAWVAWVLGAFVVVCSIPFLPWLVGWPALTWGRALMLTSAVSPIRVRPTEP